MRLTKQTGHAIQILVDCALAREHLVKVASLSDRLDITKQNTFKIVHLLSRAEFIASVRGPSGGIRLARPASNISIGDVVKAMEDTNVDIVGERPVRGAAPPALSSLFGDALAAFISVLDAHTIADLAKTHKGPAVRAATSAVPDRRRPSARKA